ncbi:MAG: hypothetical protein ABFC57_17695, partial [Veillonellales bacterium]
VFVMLEDADHIDVLRAGEICRYEDGKIDQPESKKHKEGGTLRAIHGNDEIIPSRPLAEDGNGARDVRVERSGESLKAGNQRKGKKNIFITSLSTS